MIKKTLYIEIEKNFTENFDGGNHSSSTCFSKYDGLTTDISNNLGCSLSLLLPSCVLIEDWIENEHIYPQNNVFPLYTLKNLTNVTEDTDFLIS